MAKENFLIVVVQRGTLIVDKVTHTIGAEVKLLEEEAARLIGLGVVAPVKSKTAPQVLASSQTQGDSQKQAPEAAVPGAPSASQVTEGAQITSSDGPSVKTTTV